MTRIRTALVIGGGVAGPATALALRRAGIEASVHEAYDGTADGVGGTLTIAPNGLDALRAVGAEQAVADAGLPMTRTVLANGRGRTLAVLRHLADLPPSRALWRGDLYRALTDVAAAHGVPIETGKRLVGADETAGGVTARFADGTTAHADLLVGADGAHSTVRTLIDPGGPGPAHVPLLNFGGEADGLVPGADPETSYFVFGRRAFLGYWSQPNGRTAWFANVPHPDPMTIAQARRVPVAEWAERLRALYEGDVPGRDLLARTPADRLVPFGSVEIMPSARRWHGGRMVLVGDAAHVPSPSSGQGASLAAEDAVALARCLRDLPGPEAALAAYERMRRPRVEKVAARAARTNSGKAMGPVAQALMGAVMPLATRTFMTPERMLGVEQRHRVDWDSPVA